MGTLCLLWHKWAQTRGFLTLSRMALYDASVVCQNDLMAREHYLKLFVDDLVSWICIWIRIWPVFILYLIALAVSLWWWAMVISCVLSRLLFWESETFHLLKVTSEPDFLCFSIWKHIVLLDYYSEVYLEYYLENTTSAPYTWSHIKSNLYPKWLTVQAYLSIMFLYSLGIDPMTVVSFLLY